MEHYKSFYDESNDVDDDYDDDDVDDAQWRNWCITWSRVSWRVRTDRPARRARPVRRSMSLQARHSASK